MIPNATNTLLRMACVLLAVALASRPSRADVFVWQSTCLSANWWACCEDVLGHYNNWWTAPYVSCPSFPSSVDDVEIGAGAVDVTSTCWAWSLHSGGVFRMFDGGLDVHTTATFDYHLEWNAGSLVRGTFDILNTAELRTTGGKWLSGATLNIYGTAIAAAPDAFNLSMDNHAILDIKPLGLFELQTDTNILVTVGAMVGPDGVRVSPGGTLRKVLAGGVSEIDVPFNNDGTTEIRAGTLRLRNAYGASTGAFVLDPGTVLEIITYKWNPGTTITGDGLVRLGRPGLPGYLDIAAGADVTVPNLELTATGFGTQRRGDGRLRVSNTFNWLEGGFAAPGYGINDILPGATAALTGDGDKLLVSQTLNNGGVATWTGNGNLNMLGGDGPARLNNLAGATFDIQTDADIAPICCGFAGQYIDNAGLFKKSAGGDVTSISPTFTNAGMVEARSGTLSFYSFTQSAGRTRLLGGNIGGSEPLVFAGGILDGSGTVVGRIINSGGEVSPGLSPGIITLSHPFGAHDYTQGAGGSLKIEIGGPAVGTGYDRLAVGGVASLNGTLKISLINGFVPSVGATFDVLTALLVDGSFSTVTLTGFPTTLSAEVLYSSTKVTVRIVPGPCPTCPGNLLADGRLDGNDVQPFVACALAGSITGGCACADMDGNYAFDSTDWSLFVGKLLADPDATCP